MAGSCRPSRDAAAQYLMGMAYLEGKSVPQDLPVAAAWFYKAAMQGNADAQLRLGYMYARGIGVPVDKPKAVAWLEKAASAGNTVAGQWLKQLD